jgi:hypothetical protein
MRLVRAALLKVLRRPAAVRTLAVVALIFTLIYLSIGSSVRSLPPQQVAGIETLLVFPSAYTSLGTFLISFGSLAAAALAGLIAGAEWAWNTFRVAIARGESRVRYVLALFSGLAILVAIAVLVLYLFGVGLVLLADAIGGVDPGSPGDPAGLGRLPAVVLGTVIAVVVATGIGFTLSFLLRNQIAGVVGVVALSIGEQLMSAVIPDDLERYGPTASGSVLVTEGGANGFSSDWLVLLGVNLVYLVLFLGAAALYARRAEVQ